MSEPLAEHAHLAIAAECECTREVLLLCVWSHDEMSVLRTATIHTERLLGRGGCECDTRRLGVAWGAF